MRARRTATGPELRRCASRLVVGLAAAAVLLFTHDAAAASPDSVFHIDRNKNRNQVHYGVKVDDECRPAGPEPVYNYWLRLAREPVEIEPLSFFQQTAYGFQKQEVQADGRIEVRLRALPERQLVIRLAKVAGACKAETFMRIDGQQAFLDKVFVFSDEGLVLPTVRYIELHGRSNDGHSLYERIDVNR